MACVLILKSTKTTISSKSDNMGQHFISTIEAAAMLRVAETTIKRWADDNLLPCARTPGGHRKFLLADVARFAEEEGLTIAGAEPPPMTPEQMEQLQIGVFTKNYAKIAAVFKQEALQADRKGLLALLLYLYRQHLSLPLILDEVVRPAFEEIGKAWSDGKIEIAHEHAASQAVTDALVRMSAEVHHKSANNRTAVCACVEGELHELGLRGLAYSLESEGWKVHSMGANTPSKTLLWFVQSTRPELVCLSASRERDRKELTNLLKHITTRVHAYGGKVVLGGAYVQKLQQAHLPVDHVCRTIHDVLVFTKDVFHLSSGRKKKKSG